MNKEVDTRHTISESESKLMYICLHLLKALLDILSRKDLSDTGKINLIGKYLAAVGNLEKYFKEDEDA